MITLYQKTGAQILLHRRCTGNKASRLRTHRQLGYGNIACTTRLWERSTKPASCTSARLYHGCKPPRGFRALCQIPRPVSRGDGLHSSKGAQQQILTLDSDRRSCPSALLPSSCRNRTCTFIASCLRSIVNIGTKSFESRGSKPAGEVQLQRICNGSQLLGFCTCPRCDRSQPEHVRVNQS